MRGILALGSCALCLAFGFVAGVAHVHESADHHENSRGLHLDHTHLDHPSDHDHVHGSHGKDQDGLDVRHPDHHEGDAVYLNGTATRSFEPGPRPVNAIVSVGAVAESPSMTSDRHTAVTAQPRDPPHKIPPRLRGPPA
jgi:hypothetical protein